MGTIYIGPQSMHNTLYFHCVLFQRHPQDAVLTVTVLKGKPSASEESVIAVQMPLETEKTSVTVSTKAFWKKQSRIKGSSRV